MAFVPLADVIGAGTAIDDADVSTGDSIIIRPDIDIINTIGSAIAITHQDIAVQVDGYVFGDFRGIASMPRPPPPSNTLSRSARPLRDLGARVPPLSGVEH